MPFYTRLPLECASESVKSVTLNVTLNSTFRFCKAVFVTLNVTLSVTLTHIFNTKSGKSVASFNGIV